MIKRNSEGKIPANAHNDPEVFIKHYQEGQTDEDFLGNAQKSTENEPKKLAQKVLGLIEIDPKKVLANQEERTAEDFLRPVRGSLSSGFDLNFFDNFCRCQAGTYWFQAPYFWLI